MKALRTNHDPIMNPLFHPSSCRSPRLWVAGPVNELVDACATGLVGAIVTNPDVFAAWVKADARPPEQIAARLADETGLPVFLQLFGPDLDGFMKQAEAIQTLDSRLIPKLPATAAGLSAAARLAPALPVLITAVATVSQAAAASAAGARFLCPYFARLRDCGIDPAALCRESSSLFSRLGSATEIIPASVRTAGDFELALNSGSTGAIIFTGLFRELLDHPTVRQALEGFQPAWDSIPNSILKP